MPYKHIAAHLNKTELACRLHYHQLSHGSTRRKRTTSCSSGSSDPASARPALASSPMRKIKARSLSPAQAMGGGGGGGYLSVAVGSEMQLPSIVAGDGSPRLPAMLPKPEAAGVGFARPSESPRGYPMMMMKVAEPMVAGPEHLGPAAGFPPPPPQQHQHQQQHHHYQHQHLHHHRQHQQQHPQQHHQQQQHAPHAYPAPAPAPAPRQAPDRKRHV